MVEYNVSSHSLGDLVGQMKELLSLHRLIVWVLGSMESLTNAMLAEYFATNLVCLRPKSVKLFRKETTPKRKFKVQNGNQKKNKQNSQRYAPLQF